jgi:hypothetical protein
MTLHGSLDTALEPIREAVEADGARLRVTGRRGDVLELLLEQPPEACERCLLPKSDLEAMAADVVRESDPTIRAVEVTIVAIA